MKSASALCSAYLRQNRCPHTQEHLHSQALGCLRESRADLRRYRTFSAFESNAEVLTLSAFEIDRSTRTVGDFRPRSSWLMYVTCTPQA